MYRNRQLPFIYTFLHCLSYNTGIDENISVLLAVISGPRVSASGIGVHLDLLAQHLQDTRHKATGTEICSKIMTDLLA